MQKPTHVLELNGRRYNALTGQLLDSEAAKSVDGILASAPTPEPAKPRPEPIKTAQPAHYPAHKGQAMDIQRGPVHHAKHHPVQHSKTLMRQAVHRPSPSLKRQHHAVAHTGALVSKIRFDIVPKHSAMVVDEERLRRAKKIARSGLIQRFAMQQPAPRRLTPAYEQRPSPAPVPRATPAREDDVFEHALAIASHHETAATKKKPTKARRLRQITSIAASCLAIVMILGFVAYQNAATIELKLASSRSGVNASLPAWQPSGFHLGTFAYGPGTVTVKYNNPASGQHFDITQTASNWNSSSLLSDYVYPHNETYDTILSNGTTIYTYGQQNATWVNGGIWYRLTSDGTLSPDQIVNIATSM